MGGGDNKIKLKADRLHSRDYPHMPPDYKQTKTVQAGELGQTDTHKPTD